MGGCYSYSMKQSVDVEVRGTGAPIFVVALIMLITALAMPVGLYLTGTPLGEACGALDPKNVIKIWGVCLALIVGLCFFAGHRGTRRVSIAGGRIRYRSWFSNKSWDARTVTDVTYQRFNNPDGADLDDLVFWHGDEQLLRLSMDGWQQAGLTAFLQALAALNPTIKLAPEVRQIFSDII